MNLTLKELGREWRELCRSRTSREAVAKWTETEPLLAGMTTLNSILDERRDDAVPGFRWTVASVAPAGWLRPSAVELHVSQRVQVGPAGPDVAQRPKPRLGFD